MIIDAVAGMWLERLRREYFLSLNAGRCTKSFWNPFAAFNRCYDEAFAKLESLTYEDNIMTLLYRVYYDDKLVSCIPDPVNYREKAQELVRIYSNCRTEAG